MKNYNISVEILGKHHSPLDPTPKFQNIGESQFFKNYRFYLSFENSNCDDYITEKAFHGFYASFAAGTIPIVFGGGDYNEYFPPGSFIDLNKLNSTEHLAKIIKSMSQPEAWHVVESFYTWHSTVNPAYDRGYELDLATKGDFYIHDYSKRAGWRNLCERLWLEQINNHSSLAEMVIKGPNRGKCHRTPSRYTGFF